MKFLHLLTEAGVTFGGKAFPKEGQVVILAGGAGSGKGFILNNLLLINAKVFDVDALKTTAIGMSKLDFKKNSKHIDKLFMEYLKKFVADPPKEATQDEIYRAEEMLSTGEGIKDFDAVIDPDDDSDEARMAWHFNLKNSANTSLLHGFVDYMDYDKKKKGAFFGNLAKNKNLVKPNVVFDVTLKNTKALAKIWNYISDAGYDPLNVHLVWILNDIEVAYAQNLTRDRTVSRAVFDSTHKGASATMKKIVHDFDTPIPGTGIRVSDMVQGDVWIIPSNKEAKDNRAEVFTRDTGTYGPKPKDKKETYDDLKGKRNFKYREIKNDKKVGREENVLVIHSFNSYHLKEQGEPIKTLKQVEEEGIMIYNHPDFVENMERSGYVLKGDIRGKINSYVPDDDDSQW